MDASKEYIKMCEKAGEIQPTLKLFQNYWGTERPYRDRDWEDGDFWAKFDSGLGYVTGVAFNCEDSYYSEPTGDVVWLPRQDQLQEMVFGKFAQDTWYRVIKDFIWYFNWRMDWDFSTVQTYSPEMWWLAFVMKEKYNKVWNGEDWIKENH